MALFDETSDAVAAEWNDGNVCYGGIVKADVGGVDLVDHLKVLLVKN